MQTRIYKVKHSLNGASAESLVRAGTPAQAIRHVVKNSVTAEVAGQDDIVKMVSAGSKVEEAATDEPAAG